MMPRPLPASQRKADVLHDDLLAAGRHDADALDDEAVGTAAAAPSASGLGRQQREQIGETLPALPGADEAAPVGDRQIDRRERARAQDRAGDDDAGGGLLIDHEIGADREHARLQHHAQHLGCRSEAAGDVAGAPLARQVFGVGSLQSAPMRPVIPIAVRTSALRRLASASDVAGHGKAGRGPRRLARHGLGQHA